MTFRLGAYLRAGTALAVLTIATGAANAGGFAIREQSAYFQGMSFAGEAAGGDLSGMFWNPAVMTQFAGMQSASSYSWIIPYANQNVSPGSSFFGILPGVSNSGDQALVPGSYMSYQVNPNLWIGMSVNAPFGLSVTFPDAWAGRNYAGSTTLSTYNAVPSIAYRLNDWISIGAGVQIEYARADLSTGLPVNGFGLGFPASLGNQADITGHGWGYGFTAGVTLSPTPATTIGLGYRSAINQKINGTLVLPPGPLFAAPASSPGSVSTTLNLPDMVSLGIRQRLDMQWTFFGTVEWTNWSRIGTATVVQPSGAPATIAGTAVTLPFQYQDGWFFALGAEYQASDRLTLRAGAAYEISPITDQVRTPRLPDNDRFWLSAGASWKIWRGFTADLAYTHIFVKDTPINVGPGNPWFNPAAPVIYIGTSDPSVDIISLGVKFRWDEPKTALITK